MTAALFGLGPLELLIVLVILVVLFLPSLLPKLIRRFSQTFTTIREMADKEVDKMEGEEEE